MRVFENTTLEFKAPKSKNKKKSFYKVSNHHELYKIGEQFYQDYLNGVSSFAISSTGYYQSQQNSILGLASFFEHKEDGLKVAVVSKNLDKGLFEKLTGVSQRNRFKLGDDVDLNFYNFNDHFDLFDLEEYLDAFEGFDDEFSHAYAYKKLKKYYDIILWDVPNLESVKSNTERYHNMIIKFDSLSIIVAKTLTSKRDIEDVKYFFNSYGISLKGLLINGGESSRELKTGLFKKFWRRSA